MKVKYVKKISISYQYRTYIATFLPFRAYSIDNQLIIDTMNVALCQRLSSLLVLLALVIVHFLSAISQTILDENYSAGLEIEYFK